MKETLPSGFTKKPTTYKVQEISMRGYVPVRGDEEFPKIPRLWIAMTWVLVGLSVALFLFIAWAVAKPMEEPVVPEVKAQELPPSALDPCLSHNVWCEGETHAVAPKQAPSSILATVTAYSRVEGCDDPACIMASGRVVYVGAAACPRRYKLGTEVMVGDRIVTCEDRTAKKYDGRFDIFFESYEEARRFGVQKLEIRVL